MKKVFIISTILLVTVLIFLGIYTVAMRGNATIAQETGKRTASEKKGSVAPAPQKAASGSRETKGNDPYVDKQKVAQKKRARNDRVIVVSSQQVVAPYVDAEKEVIRFYAKDGTVWEVPIIGGAAKVFSDEQLEDFVYAAWAPDGVRALTKFVGRDGAVRIYFFDHRTQRGTKLKAGIDRVDWTVVGDRIIYTYVDAASRRVTLNIADPDGKNWRVLAQDVPKGTRFVNIPKSSHIAYWRAPNPYEKTELKIVNLLDSTPQPRTIFRGHYNADYLFSPNGERLLISSTTVKGSNARQLGIANARGGEYRPLHIPTNVRKCTWSSDNRTIYCAYPTADRDTFWKIDTTTNKKERVIPIDDVVNASVRYKAFNLFLSPEEDALFFINALDGKLYRINLS